MMKRIIDFFGNHSDYHCYGVTMVALLVMISIMPCVKFLPVTWGYENGVLENIQLVFLFLMGYFALRAKVDKKFFYVFFTKSKKTFPKI